jgi:hypothetical protein
MSLTDLDEDDFFVRKSRNGNYFNYKSNQIHIEIPPESAYFDNTIAHELNHFYWHNITPYGLFLNEITEYQNNIFLKYSLTHTKKIAHLPIIRPIYEYALKWKELNALPEEHTSQYKEVGPLIKHFIEPWIEAVSLEKILEGTDNDDTRTITANNAISIFNRVELAILQQKQVVPLSKNNPAFNIAVYKPLPYVVERSLPSACPEEMRTSNDRFPFGASHIFESVAQIYEQTVDTKMASMLKDREGFIYLVF